MSISLEVLDLITRQKQQGAQLGSYINRAAEMGYGQKNDPSPYVAGQQYMHGVGGLFSAPGTDPVVLSTIVPAQPGLATALPVLRDPVYSSDFGGQDVPIMQFITGQTTGNLDSWNNQPNGICDDPPIAGILKACAQTAQYGLLSAKTEPINRRRIGRTVNNGETLNLRVPNNPVSDDPLVPTSMAGVSNLTFMINEELPARFYEAAMGFQRMIRPLVWTGDPANNKAGGGARQFQGILSLFNTGHRDMFTQNLCPTLDSVIASFGNTQITASLGGLYIYDYLRNFFRYLNGLAEDTGLAPVRFVIVMRRDLFFQMTDIWPILEYAKMIGVLDTVNGSQANGVLTMSGDQNASLRDDMRRRQVLPIDGAFVEVVFDNTIPESAVGGQSNVYSTDIHIIPLTILGGVPVTYWQFFNYDNAQGRQFDQLVHGQTFTTDSGRFLWSFNQRNACADFAWWTEPRLMVHAPHLGGRIEDVAYNPGIHSRDWEPGSPNYYNGGRTNPGQLPTYYSGWDPSSGFTPFPLG